MTGRAARGPIGRTGPSINVGQVWRDNLGRRRHRPTLRRLRARSSVDARQARRIGGRRRRWSGRRGRCGGSNDLYGHLDRSDRWVRNLGGSLTVSATGRLSCPFVWCFVDLATTWTPESNRHGCPLIGSVNEPQYMVSPLGFGRRRRRKRAEAAPHPQLEHIVNPRSPGCNRLSRLYFAILHLPLSGPSWRTSWSARWPSWAAPDVEADVHSHAKRKAPLAGRRGFFLAPGRWRMPSPVDAFQGTLTSPRRVACGDLTLSRKVRELDYGCTSSY